MTDHLDRETTAAVEALAHRLRVRDAAIHNAEDYADAEVFAAEFLAALRGHGWRPTEARLIPIGSPGRPGSGSGPGDEYRRIRTEWENREHPHRNEPEGAA
jgi:hypothetical protein